MITPLTYPHDSSAKPAGSNDTMELHAFRWGGQFWVQTAGRLHHMTRNGTVPYQSASMAAFRRWLPDKPRHVIDVGVNVGFMAMQFSGWADRVSGFEPTPHVAEAAAHNLVLNHASHNVALYQAAVSDRDGTADLLDVRDNSAVNRVTRNRHLVRKNRVLEVPTVALDRFAWTDVDGIKIDTEGSELLVINGAMATIQRCRPVIMAELLDKELRALGGSVQAIFNAVLPLNYSAFDNTGQDLGIDWATAQAFKASGDVLFVPKERIS